ncbi:MAG: type IV pilus assembly protein PilM [Sedimentisphaerales bacterium]|nr:type IV pilus assembly protein PilM [Sedimentisphaerales bacterium]
MAAETGTVWAIDIGSNSLKALSLSTERGVVEVVGFDNIRHGKVLTGGDVTDAEREELIALSLRKFVNKYGLSLDEIVVSVPSQNSFARFVTLPPVEAKRIPEMVKFEAVQQIPFGINDVQWDWQLMSEPDSSEIKVGIFAIKNEVVNSALEHFNREDVQPGYVQMAPMALYNYLLHDRPELVTSDTQATVVLNVGAENTDLVVCTKSGVWQRCILIGGNAFTKAISEAFRLNFEKAEKLKRTAPVSKYARQIFQAMRPVFTDLASEVQRSLGFYNSSNPNTKIVKIVAMGGGTRLRGLTKYLQQTLQIPVERPDTFKRLVMGPGVSPAKFHENVTDFGVVYGLALQGLGLARIESNLLPRNIARSMAWASKGRYFIIAACMLLAVSLLRLGRNGWDSMNYNKNAQVRSSIARTVGQVQQAQEQYAEVKSQGATKDAAIEKEFEPFQYREVVPQLYQTILSALPNEDNDPKHAALHKAFAEGRVEDIEKTPRKERPQVFVTNMSMYFTNDLDKGQFGGADSWRRSRAAPGGTDGLMEGMDEYEYAMMMEAEYGMDMYGMGMYGAQQTEEKKQGFVLTVIGYTPYGDKITEVQELLDPHGVDDHPNKWGFVTRLAHLNDLVEDGNSPFQLYKKAEKEQFSLEVKQVDLKDSDSMPPEGVGVWEEKVLQASTTTAAQTGRLGSVGTATQTEWELVDPMTRETINKVPVLNEDGKQVIINGKPVYRVNDHWFVLNVKFEWTEAPEPPKQATGTSLLGGRGVMSTRKPSTSSSSSRSIPSDDM